MHKKTTISLALLGAAAFGSFIVSAHADDAPYDKAFSSLSKTRDDLSDKDLARVKKITTPTADFSKPEKYEKLQGGAGTSKKIFNHDAFSQFNSNIGFEGERDFKLGNALFRKFWVSSPSSTQASDGLGPLFNARACQSCHLKDGRGRLPQGDEKAVSVFLRLARPAQTEEEKKLFHERKALVFPDQTYGGQFQNFAVPGLSGEGEMTIEYTPKTVVLGDGTKVQLRAPKYGVKDLAYGEMGKETSLSPRMTPQMIGLGLVEQIPEADILALADAQAKSDDGIKGIPQLVWDEQSKTYKLGRFGWKAANVSIRGQAAGAFAGDIGISTDDNKSHYGDCTKAQTECLKLPTGVQKRLGESEAPHPVLDLVTFYSQNLAVPARRKMGEPEILQGKKLFYDLGCATCHNPKYVTSRNAPIKAHKFQLIWPYSDFLLHDMGEGLADGQVVGAASGQHWRTPPLWGIGLTKAVSGQTEFLHDGRARNLTEAILWHDGEAKTAKDGFAALQKQGREALLKFLNSL